MTAKRLSWAELRALGPTCNIATLARAFDISEPVARERHRQGEWEELGIRVLRLGHSYRCITADILKVLGIEPERDGAASQQAAAGQLRAVPSPASRDAR